MPPPLNTGFVDLDRTLGQLRPGTLTVTAAAPGYGVQMFLLGVAAHVAGRLRRPVTVLTVMTAREEVAGRIACIVSGEGYRPSRLMTDRERLLLANRAEALLHLLPVTVAESGGDLPALCAEARWLHARRPADLLVILGPPEPLSAARCATDNFYGGDLNAPIDTVIGLRRLAVELQMPVLLQSDVAHRASRREQPQPLLSDLPALGCISNHCDATILIWADDVYVPGRRDWMPAEVTVAHNRHGMVGNVTLSFSARRNRFENLAWPPFPDLNETDAPPI